MKAKTLFAKNYFEEYAWAHNLYVCGIDEAGRGCLSGPLVAAAAIVPQQTTCKLLRDSKLMTEKERNTAYEWISKNCFYSYAIADPYAIDKHNVYQATRRAMKKSFLQLLELIPFSFEKIRYLVVDAVPLTVIHPYRHKTLEIYNPTHGESLSISIAAASIVAKVTRDRLMQKLSPLFPNFALDQHKGYGTKPHIDALLTNGPSIIHRTSFLGNFEKKSKNNEHQQTIC